MADTDANVVVGKGTISIDGIDCGHLSEPVTMRLARDYYDVEGQHRVGVIKKVKTKEALFIATACQEPTLTMIRALWDQGTGANSGTSQNIGQDDSFEHTIIVTGPAPGGTYTTRTLTVYRAVSINEGAMVFDKGAETVIPIEFECLKDTANLNADSEPIFGKIVDS